MKLSRYYILLSLIAISCQGVTDTKKNESDPVTASDTEQIDSFLITSRQVGLFKKGMTIKEAINLFPENQVAKKVGYGEFEDDTYDDYELFDSKKKHLLTLTPRTQGDINQTINRILVLDKRFKTSEGISLLSNYNELKSKYDISNYSPDMNHIVLEVDSINAWFSITKDQLSDNWWNKEEKKINPDKIPDTARFDSFVIWWK